LRQDGLDLIEGEAHFTGPKMDEIALTDGGKRETQEPCWASSLTRLWGTRSRTRFWQKA
jgi:hypothetical protein